MALVVEITIKINRSYQNLSEISPNIITLHLLEFQELFLEHEGVTFFSFIHHINIKLWIVFILFSFIGKLIPFLKVLKGKKEYGNDSNLVYVCIQFHLRRRIQSSPFIFTKTSRNFYTSWHRKQNKIVTSNNAAKSRRGESRPTLVSFSSLEETNVGQVSGGDCGQSGRN